MEEINNYITRARLQGQSDEQTRQALLNAGWSFGLVNEAFISYKVPIAKKKRSKKPLILISVITAVVIIVVTISVLLDKRTSYQSVTEQFITAMQTGNETKVGSLESPAFVAYIKKAGAPSTNFYKDCQEGGEFCTAYFKPAFLNKAKVTYKDYTARDGVKGKEVIFTLKEPDGTPSCPSSATTITYLDIELVPKGSSWLIDSAQPGSNTNGSINLCLAPGGKSSTTD